MASTTPNHLLSTHLHTTTNESIVLDQLASEATESKEDRPTLGPKEPNEEGKEKSVLGSDLHLFAVNLRPLKRLATTTANKLSITNLQAPKEDPISSSSCACSKIISEEDLCLTPKAIEHRIPEAKACPPAPKKKAPPKRKRDHNHNQLAVTLHGALDSAHQRAYLVNPPDVHTFPDCIKALFKQ